MFQVEWWQFKYTKLRLRVKHSYQKTPEHSDSCVKDVGLKKKKKFESNVYKNTKALALAIKYKIIITQPPLKKNQVQGTNC